MALVSIVLLLQLLFNCLEASPVSLLDSRRSCLELQFQVSATAQNAEYDVVNVKNNIDATSFALDLDTWSSPNATQRFLRNITVSDTFGISAQLCIPINGTKRNHLQIATHGLGFDKRYWDATINPLEYSYVDVALAAGYSILTYDRLGNGLSDKPDANTVLQAPLHLAILQRITEMARSGDLLESAKSSNNLSTTFTQADMSFTKIIHVGHSYGSILTTALLTASPNVSDAAILTGYIPNPRLANVRWTSFGLEYAPENNATLFANRTAGYMVQGTRSAVQTGFFCTRANTTAGTGGFEAEMLDYAFDIRQTFTAGEIVGLPFPGAAPAFMGPVLFVVPQYDFINCQGDCSEAIDVDALRGMYPMAKSVDTYVQEGAGHGMALHRSASLGYRKGLEWLEGNGL